MARSSGIFGLRVTRMQESVIVTNPARCRDCYRCVRNCNVKAIRVRMPEPMW